MIKENFNFELSSLLLSIILYIYFIGINTNGRYYVSKIRKEEWMGVNGDVTFSGYYHFVTVKFCLMCLSLPNLI